MLFSYKKISSMIYVLLSRETIAADSPMRSVTAEFTILYSVCKSFHACYIFFLSSNILSSAYMWSLCAADITDLTQNLYFLPSILAGLKQCLA